VCVSVCVCLCVYVCMYVCMYVGYTLFKKNTVDTMLMNEFTLTIGLGTCRPTPHPIIIQSNSQFLSFDPK
jgi:hypothetical protein